MVDRSVPLILIFLSHGNKRLVVVAQMGGSPPPVPKGDEILLSITILTSIPFFVPHDSLGLH